MTKEDRSAEPKTISLDSSLAEMIKEELGVNVYLCYQCVKCTSGCPVAEFFDWQPNQIMRALQLGQEDIVFESKTPWLCASCLTCTTRCPQGLDITAIMELITREATKRGYKPQVPETEHFNKAFMREVNIWNRSYEPGLMAELILQHPKNAIEDIELYLKFFQKRKVAFFPHPTRMPSKRKVKPHPKAASAVAYYPGCSLESTATEFDISTQAVCEAIGLDLVEPDGWVCCGSSAAHRADPEAAFRLPMENLAMFERMGFSEVTMPCAACYNRHKTAVYEVHEKPHHKEAVDQAMGYTYQDGVRVSTMIESISEHIGPDKLASMIKKPLEGLNVVCYYGCLLTRPPDITHAEHPENPTDMDELMKALGANVLDWSYKTTCCGAGHSLSRPDIVLELSGDIIKHARETGADVIAVACPLCHMNLDARQFQMDLKEPMPILYFTQLMAIALDLPPKASALKRNVVDPFPILQEKQLLDTS
jgi:heterodisulfide reductase subunit B